MAAFLIPLLFFILLSLGAAGLLLAVSRRRKTVPVRNADGVPAGRTERSLAFRWRYVAAPVALAVLAFGIAAYFYRLLPQDVAYRFAADGTGDGFVNRAALAAALVVPQLLLACVALAVARLVARVGGRFSRNEAGRSSAVESIITVMSNMVILPQVVLFFAMLDVFSYNAFQVHLVEPWIVALMVMLLGGPVLAVLFFRAVQQAKAETTHKR